MRSHHAHIRLLIAATAALLAAALGPAAAAAPNTGAEPAHASFVPGVTDSTTGVLRELRTQGVERGRFVPGVTDSTTGVLRELRTQDVERGRFIPGVTDSTTGVLHELERRGQQPQAVASPVDTGDNGLGRAVAAVAGAGLLAAVVAACLALAVGRVRRVAI